MTTITINNSKIEEDYSPYELKLQFIKFLQEQGKELNLYEVSVDNIPKWVKEAYKDMSDIIFIKR